MWAHVDYQLKVLATCNSCNTGESTLPDIVYMAPDFASKKS